MGIENAAATGIGLGVTAATLGIAAKAVEGIGKSGKKKRKKKKAHKKKDRGYINAYA